MKSIFYILLFSQLLNFLGVFAEKVKEDSSGMNSVIWEKVEGKKSKNNNLYKFFNNITFRSFYILIIRSFPILPHVLGSYIIASSNIKIKVILINTFLGSVFYYIFLYLIIWNV